MSNTPRFVLRPVHTPQSRPSHSGKIQDSPPGCWEPHPAPGSPRLPTTAIGQVACSALRRPPHVPHLTHPKGRPLRRVLVPWARAVPCSLASPGPCAGDLFSFLLGDSARAPGLPPPQGTRCLPTLSSCGLVSPGSTSPVVGIFLKGRTILMISGDECLPVYPGCALNTDKVTLAPSRLHPAPQ